MGRIATIACVMVLGWLCASSSAKAWFLFGTNGSDQWILTSKDGHLRLCDPTTGSDVPWPGGSPPANPLTEDALIHMREGDDFLRIIINGGTYGLCEAEHVDYNGHTITIVGGPGNDHLLGGSGNDHIFGDNTSDILSCALDSEGGDDILSSGGGTDILYGCGGDDIFDHDWVAGGLADTTVYAGQGADCIEARFRTVYTRDPFTGSLDDGMVDEYDRGLSASVSPGPTDGDVDAAPTGILLECGP